MTYYSLTEMVLNPEFSFGINRINVKAFIDVEVDILLAAVD